MLENLYLSLHFPLLYKYCLIHSFASLALEKNFTGYDGGLKPKNKFATILLKGDVDIMPIALVIESSSLAIQSLSAFLGGGAELSVTNIIHVFLWPTSLRNSCI